MNGENVQTESRGHDGIGTGPILAMASGALLMAPVLKKRSGLRWAAAAAGGALVYTGVSVTRLHPDAAPVQHLRQSITIGKSPEELWRLWNSQDAMARVGEPFARITPLAPDHVRWCIDLPLGRKLEGQAIKVDERPGELVHWRSVPDSMLQVDEWMRFKEAPQGRGTEATLEYRVDYSRFPAGVMLRAVADFFKQAPRSAVRKALHNFKSLAETGELPTLARNPSARAQSEEWKGDLV